MTAEERAAEAAFTAYPLTRSTGPSVVTINGVVASLAATEAMSTWPDSGRQLSN